MANILLEHFMENEGKYRQDIDEIWNEIPLLNSLESNDFQDNMLVRFRGMVQDMYTPEYFLQSYEVHNTATNKNEIRSGKYKDVITFQENEKLNAESSLNIRQERQTIYMVSMPGLNTWVQTLELQSNNDSSLKKYNNRHSNLIKRKVDDLNSDSVNTDLKNELVDGDTNTNSCNENKRKVQDNSSSSTASKNNISPEFILNFPLPDRPGKACLVKLYNNYESMKLNEMYEIVGFLSINPILSTVLSENSDDDMDIETGTINPPPSLVPRIHTIHSKKIIHNNPLVTTLEISQIKYQAAKIRSDLHLVLSQLLLGDKVAADYLICHLISTVYLRKDLLSLGQFTVNLSNIPSLKYPEYTKQLYDILESMVTKSYYFPLTLDNMNTCKFIPNKDYDCNRITSGLLQLSNNTHLFIDESKLQAGQLNQSGVLNMTALANIIRTQKVKYDFKYYELEFDVDVPVLILSEGKSLLPSDVHIPIVADSSCQENLNEIIQAVKHYLQPTLLDNIRKYLTMLQHNDCELTDVIQEIVQEDFVELRQNTSMTADDLHHLLVLSRLLSLSYGHDIVQKDSWVQARNMDKERRNRIENKPTRGNEC